MFSTAQDAAAKSAGDLLRNSLGTLFVYREKVKFHKRAARAQSCCNPDTRLPPERLVRKVEHPEPVVASKPVLTAAADIAKTGTITILVKHVFNWTFPLGFA